MNGRWPDDTIDHKNSDTLDNRWSNLRECTRSQNNCNKVALTNTGYKNIYETISGTFQVRVVFLGDEVTKTFKTLEEARVFAEGVRASLHGEFSRE